MPSKGRQLRFLELDFLDFDPPLWAASPCETPLESGGTGPTMASLAPRFSNR